MTAFISPAGLPSLTRLVSSPPKRQLRVTPTATAANSNKTSFHLTPPATSVASLYLPARSDVPSLSGGDGHSGNGRSGGDGDRGWDGGQGDGTSAPAAFVATLSQLMARYNRILASFPLRTKSVSAGILALVSDVLAQCLSGNSVTELDIARLLRFAMYGLLVIGPQGHYWFGFLERTVRMHGPPSIAVKLALDQLTYAPAAMATFFAVMRLAEGGSFASAVQNVRENWKKTMAKSYKVWPLVNLVNFSVVPPAQRVAFTSLVSVFWIAFLSVVANGGETAGATS